MSSKIQPQKEIIVDGEKYIVQLFSPTVGVTLQAKLFSILGDPFIKVAGMFKGSGTIENAIKTFDLDELDMDQAALALQSLFSNLKPEEVVPLMREILSSTFFAVSFNPVNDQFETHFSGRYMHLYKLVGQTIGAQYADFLSGLKKRKSAEKSALASIPKPTSRLNSATTSSGK